MMTGQLRETIRIVDDASVSAPDIRKNLSIELMPDGFVFAVMDKDAFRYLAMAGYQVPQASDQPPVYEQLCQEKQHISLLNEKHEQICISYYAQELVLIPDKLYLSEEKNTYFSFCTPLPTRHHVRADYLNILKAYALYAVPDHLPPMLEKYFPGYQLKHHGTALIEGTLASQRLDKWQADIVMHIKQSHFELLIFREGTFAYYRSFPIQTFEDLLYYLFYVLEQQHMSPEKLRVFVLGELAMDSNNFATLSSFFRHVSIPDRNDIFKYASCFDSIPYHFYFNLLNLTTCG